MIFLAGKEARAAPSRTWLSPGLWRTGG